MSEHLLAGRYRLKSLLGSGGMGRVWRAHDEFLGRTVAVKEVLLPTEAVAADELAQLCERTIREARAAAALAHPSIITVHDVLNEGNRPWIVMDLIHGRSLEEIRTSDGPMPPQRVAQIGLQLLDALAVAHCHGILHRDVKPHNVLLGNDARAVLTDFGIATRAGDHRLTSAGGMLGSPGYMAPERLQEDDTGPSCDLWSLAATLYTAVEGEPPFRGNDVLALLGAVLTQPPVPPRRAGPLGEVLLAMLEKHPAARPHPSDLHRVFHAVATGSVPPPKVWTGPAMAAPALTGPATVRGPVPPPAVPLPPPARTEQHRTPLLAGTLAVVTVAATALGGYLLRQGNDLTQGNRPQITASTTTSTTAAAAASTTSAPQACSLLTGAQASELTGTDRGTAASDKECTWSTLQITVKSFADQPGKSGKSGRSGIEAAKDSFNLFRQQAVNRAGLNTSDPAATVMRSAPKTVPGAGEESFAQDETIQGPFSSISSQVILRSESIVITIKARPSKNTTSVKDLHTQVTKASRYATANLRATRPTRP